MSELLELPPFGPRDDARFLAGMNELTRFHLEASPELRRMWPRWNGAASIEELPFVHVGVFKQLLLRSRGAAHQRILRSSGTSGGAASRIALDEESSELQARSSVAILREVVGPERAPLLVLDRAASLRQRGEVSARIAAALSLRPLASEILFVLGDDDQIKWDAVLDAAARHAHLRVYGFTSVLWQAWQTRPELSGKRIDFVHSGGWKKLEAARVTREQFDGALLQGLAPESRVVDYYGLVEQVGIVYPLCAAGFRHVPAWAAVIARDPWTLEPVREAGMLQSMNVLPRGAPYHSVLTEDLGRVVEGACGCGREGMRFELHGRVPKAETRGCANV